MEPPFSTSGSVGAGVTSIMSDKHRVFEKSHTKPESAVDDAAAERPPGYFWAHPRLQPAVTFSSIRHSSASSDVVGQFVRVKQSNEHLIVKQKQAALADPLREYCVLQ